MKLYRLILRFETAPNDPRLRSEVTYEGTVELFEDTVQAEEWFQEFKANLSLSRTVKCSIIGLEEVNV